MANLHRYVPYRSSHFSVVKHVSRLVSRRLRYRWGLVNHVMSYPASLRRPPDAKSMAEPPTIPVNAPTMRPFQAFFMSFRVLSPSGSGRGHLPDERGTALWITCRYGVFDFRASVLDLFARVLQRRLRLVSLALYRKSPLPVADPTFIFTFSFRCCTLFDTLSFIPILLVLSGGYMS